MWSPGSGHEAYGDGYRSTSGAPWDSASVSSARIEALMCQLVCRVESLCESCAAADAAQQGSDPRSAAPCDRSALREALAQAPTAYAAHHCDRCARSAASHRGGEASQQADPTS